MARDRNKIPNDDYLDEAELDSEDETEPEEEEEEDFDEPQGQRSGRRSRNPASGSLDD